MLHIVYPELPPTSNKLYIRGTILTQKAREYKERFSYYVAQRYLPEISQLDPNGVYALHLRFYIEELENKNFFNTRLPPSKRPKSRYKKVDLTNRIKLLEDCVRDAIAIDDSQTFAASQEKHQDPFNPRVEIFVQEVDMEQFGLRREIPLVG